MIPRNLSGAFILALGLAATAGAQVKINEIRIEQPGPDFDEFVELKGTPGTNLAGLFYVVIGNDDFQLPPNQNGYVEEVIALSGTIPASGLFVIAKPSFTLGAANLVVPFTFEGGNNKTHMLVEDFMGAVGDDVDADDDGVLDDPAPWASVSDSVALIQFPNADGINGDFVYSATLVGPDAGVIPSSVWRCSDTEAWRIGSLVAGVSDTPGAANPECKGSRVPIVISEIRIDEPGTDNSEYFELSGTPGASLGDLTYIVIGDGAAAAGSGVVESITPLAGQVMNANGLFLVVESTFVLPGIPDLVATGAASLNFENNDNVTHMLVRNFTGTNQQDLDTNNDGVLDITPWTEIVDWVSLVKTSLAAPRAGDEWWYSPIRVGPDGTFVPGHAYRCQPNGDWQIGLFVVGSLDSADTPGSANLGCESCGVIGSGNCFLPHAGIGCEDESCCNAVCKVDPTCCVTEWDAACVTLAQSICHTAGPPPALAINEVRIDMPGVDTQEYVEITGAPGTSLNGVAYVVIGRGPGDVAGVVESVTKLDGVTVPASGFFVFAKATFNLAPANLVVPSNGFTFNADSSKTHLLVWNLETIRGEDLDANNDCTLDRPGWVSIIDQVVFKSANDADCIYGAPAVGPDCNDFPPAHIFKCLRTNTWTVGSFTSFSLDTPGAANASCGAAIPVACGDACAGDCLAPHGGLSCSNGTCCETVCSFMPECCDTAWDALCANAAQQLPACGYQAGGIFINEIRVDEPGTDNSEYFELIGTPGASLAELTYIVIGDGTPASLSGVIEAAIPLGKFSLNANGFFLVSESTFALSGTPDFVVGLNGLNFENTDNVTHMLVRNFTGALDDDLDTNNDGVLDSTPWDAILDSIALVSTTQPAPSGASDWWYGPRIGPDGGAQPGHVYRCSPAGAWQIGQYNPVGGNDTPGEVGANCPGFVACVEGPDRNGDGCVNGADIAIILGNWDPTGSVGNGLGAGDANCDGMVGGADLAIVLGNWQPICR